MKTKELFLKGTHAISKLKNGKDPSELFQKHWTVDNKKQVQQFGMP